MASPTDGNLISVANESVESVVSFLGQTNCATDRVTTWAGDGTYSVRARAAAAGDMSWRLVQDITILPSTQYTLSAVTRAGSTPRTCRVRINMFTAGFATFLGASPGPSLVNSASADSQPFYTFTTASNAAVAQVFFETDGCAAGEDHFWDVFGLLLGSAKPTWSGSAPASPNYTLRPAADTNVTNWTTAAGSSTNLYAEIDEVTAVDTDYVKSPRTPSVSDIYELRFLAANHTPVVDTDHVVNYRLQRADDTAVVNGTVQLRQGASTVIATWVHNDIGTAWTSFQQTLTTGEAALITDYDDLRLRFTAAQA